MLGYLPVCRYVSVPELILDVFLDHSAVYLIEVGLSLNVALV